MQQHRVQDFANRYFVGTDKNSVHELALTQESIGILRSRWRIESVVRGSSVQKIAATTCQPELRAHGQIAPNIARDVSNLGTSPKWSRRVAADIVALFDIFAVLVGLCLTAAFHWRAEGGGDANVLQYVQTGLVVSAVVYFLMHSARLYETASMRNFPGRITSLLGPVVIAFMLVGLVGLSLGAVIHVPISWYPGWLFATLIMMSGIRMVAHHLLRRYAEQGRFNRNLAIYGTGRVTRRLMNHIEQCPNSINLVGVYDDRRDVSRLGGDDLPIAGNFEDLLEAGREGRVDRIVIALPQSADRRIAELAKKLEQLPVDLSVCTHIATDLIDEVLDHHKVSNIGSVGLLEIKTKPLKDWGILLKKAEDYVLAGLMLLLLSPVFLLVAISVRLDSPGPIFFRQRRHGLNHGIIEVLKFRTMRVMEDGAVVRQAVRDDPRITRVGRFLRRTSLDELPQLVNVIKGEMSLVGPRPHALVHNEKFEEILERYANRHQVKPGITGWAQVNGYRGETRTSEAMRMRVEHDLEYISKWSLWLDLRILALTPIYGLLGRNAY